MKKSPNYINEHYLIPFMLMFTAASAISLMYFIYEYSLVSNKEEYVTYYQFGSIEERFAYLDYCQTAALIFAVCVLAEIYSVIVKKRWLLLSVTVMNGLCFWYYLT
ncbi:hypothetical protein [Chondrinema litorale]|uniref:hypothetical protein n=1 Tax=Chondrinema litorale TaxID=2994555 RepID=UPI002543F646|nr:hypothetical protein [Chondrinema litorale]UZR99451.1 hypothetical protein OQ292_36900 [Chondrinema litorale]